MLLEIVRAYIYRTDDPEAWYPWAKLCKKHASQVQKYRRAPHGESQTVECVAENERVVTRGIGKIAVACGGEGVSRPESSSYCRDDMGVRWGKMGSWRVRDLHVDESADVFQSADEQSR